LCQFFSFYPNAQTDEHPGLVTSLKVVSKHGWKHRSTGSKFADAFLYVLRGMLCTASHFRQPQLASAQQQHTCPWSLGNPISSNAATLSAGNGMIKIMTEKESESRSAFDHQLHMLHKVQSASHTPHTTDDDNIMNLKIRFSLPACNAASRTTLTLLIEQLYHLSENKHGLQSQSPEESTKYVYVLAPLFRLVFTFPNSTGTGLVGCMHARSRASSIVHLALYCILELS
jgi:hypothetical protein